METDQVEQQADSNAGKESPAENETSSVVSATSMDSGCSSLANSPKGQNSISVLVAKSKKAASSLWTLLHAKVGRPITFLATRSIFSQKAIFSIASIIVTMYHENLKNFSIFT